ncbi:MAG: hypothetical protein IJ785_03910 [Bacteroidales bacterium]|nr:hypothetical protein [Bacteroidales bacterium]
MKHVKTYLLWAALLLMSGACGSRAVAQTSLYKIYVGRTGINASCIENYPIGNGLKVTITMLEASDSSAFHHLKKSLKTLPYSGPKSERTGDTIVNCPQTKSMPRIGNKRIRDFMSELDSIPEFRHVSTLKGSIATAFLGQMKNMDLEVSLENDSLTASSKQVKMLHIYCRAADPLPGDKGLYLIYLSEDTKTALVFHCPTDEVYAQSMRYVLKTTVKRAVSD